MAKPQTQEQSNILRIILLAAVITLGSIWVWWSYVYTTPTRIFNDMLSNNLNTFGVTRTVVEKQQNGSREQQIQIVLGAQNVSKSKTTIIQTDDANQENKVVSETIATPDTNYARYLEVVTAQKDKQNQPLDFKSILGVWGKQDVPEGSTSNFSQAVFGVVPFALLPPEKRAEALKFIEEKKVYTFKEVADSPESGNNTIVYSVDVNMQGYIEMIKKIDELMELNELTNVDASQYEGSEPVNVRFVVQKDSRTLTKIVDPGGNREDTFSGYGIRSLVELPGQTIPQEEIEKQLLQVSGSAN